MPPHLEYRRKIGNPPPIEVWILSASKHPGLVGNYGQSHKYECSAYVGALRVCVRARVQVDLQLLPERCRNVPVKRRLPRSEESAPPPHLEWLPQNAAAGQRRTDSLPSGAHAGATRGHAGGALSAFVFALFGDR